jgi:hypothetical protein
MKTFILLLILFISPVTHAQFVHGSDLLYACNGMMNVKNIEKYMLKISCMSYINGIIDANLVLLKQNTICLNKDLTNSDIVSLFIKWVKPNNALNMSAASAVVSFLHNKFLCKQNEYKKRNDFDVFYKHLIGIK